MEGAIFNSIEAYTDRVHKGHLHYEKEQCSATTHTFEAHVPKEEMTKEEVLLVADSLMATMDYNQKKALVKNHFIILAQKFHPDKNHKDLKEECTKVMGIVNKAFNDIMQEMSMNESKAEEVIRDEKIYRKVNDYTVTCQHYESFSIYGIPDHIHQWTTKLKGIFGANPRALPKKEGKESVGKQFGSRSQSLYVTMFNNGTIFIQGCMALQYAIETIQPMILHWFPSICSTETGEFSKFSEQLKKSLAHFVSPKMSKVSISTLSLPDTGRHTTPKKTDGNTCMLKQSNEDFQQDRNETTGKTYIQIEAKEFHQLQQQMSTAITRIQQLEEEVMALKRSNEQLMRTTGPKIGKIYERLDTLEHKPEIANQGVKTFADTAATGTPVTPQDPQTNKEDGNTRKSKEDRDKREQHRSRITFDPSKCIVIYDITDHSLAARDDNIRRIVGKDKKVTIDRISRSSYGCIIVQVGETSMVDIIIRDWKSENFGHSKVRKTIEPTKKNGVLKGVPTDIEEEDIKRELKEQGYNETEVKRYMKQGKPTTAVKVKFHTQTDLNKAISNRVTVDHLTVNVEPVSNRVMVTQCHKCLKFGHIQSRCTSNKVCRKCAEPYDESHNECDKEEKCVNCKGRHKSSDKSCPKYKEIYQRLERRQEIIKQTFENGKQE